MIDLSIWINRIRDANIAGLRKVAGIVDLTKTEADTRDTPSIWIIPGHEIAQEERNICGQTSQEVLVDVVIVYAIRNAQDKLGINGNTELSNFRSAIFNLIYGWCPIDATKAASYISGDLLTFNESTIWYIETYRVSQELYK